MKFQPVFLKASELPIVTKGWGYEQIITNNPKYCGKILHYYTKGVESSCHIHYVKDEVFRVVSGSFAVEWRDEQGFVKITTMNLGDVVHFPPGTPHRLTPLEYHSEIWEISTTHFDDDVIRIAPGASQSKKTV